MSSIKLTLRKSEIYKKQDGTYTIFLRIIKDRKISFISTGHSVLNEQWDDKNQVVIKHPSRGRLNALLNKKKSEVYNLLLQEEDRNSSVSVFTLKNKIKSGNKSGDFLAFAHEFVERYNTPHSRPTFNKYHLVLKELCLLFKGKPMFSDIDYRLLNRYLLQLNVNKNNSGTINNKFNKIKALWNAAIKCGEVDYGNNPFNNLNLPKVNPVKKEKLTKEELTKIRELNLEPGTNIWHARNSFLFSYNCMGIRIGDVVKMKIKNIQNGRLEYSMRKSADNISISLSPEASRIYDDYREGKGEDDYIFPWYDRTNPKDDDFVRIGTATSMVNNKLRLIKEMAGLSKKLTTHIARHTWAYHAKMGMIDKKIIRQALGHSKDETTENYLDSFPDSVLDEANLLVVG